MPEQNTLQPILWHNDQRFCFLRLHLIINTAVFQKLKTTLPIPTTTLSHFLFLSLVMIKKGYKLPWTQKPLQKPWSSTLMEFSRRNPRLISYGLTTKHYCNQQGLQETLWRERQYDHPGENSRGIGDISKLLYEILKNQSVLQIVFKCCS